MQICTINKIKEAGRLHVHSISFSGKSVWGRAGSAMPLATSSSWNMSHPSEKLLNWYTKYILYDRNQLQLKKYEVNSINNLNDTLQIALLSFSSQKLPLLMFVCYLEAPKNKRSSGTWLVHPSSPHLWLRRNFFEKIGNIFLCYLVALSSCNTSFDGEK